MTDTRLEKPFFHFLLNHFCLQISYLSLFLEFPLIDFFKKGIEPRFSWFIRAPDNAFLRLGNIRPEFRKLTLRILHSLLIVKDLLKFQTLVLLLINDLLIPFVKGYSVSINWFNYFNRPLVNLRCKLKLLVFSLHTLNFEFFQLLLFEHLFIKKTLDHGFDLFWIELPKTSTCWTIPWITCFNSYGVSSEGSMRNLTSWIFRRYQRSSN